jgi:hypothetical protein
MNKSQTVTTNIAKQPNQAPTNASSDPSPAELASKKIIFSGFDNCSKNSQESSLEDTNFAERDNPARLRQRFEHLAQVWREQYSKRAHISVGFPALSCPAFNQLLLLGRPSLPLILEAYQDNSLPWAAVLCAITGQSQFGNGLQGDLEATRQAWLAWGHQNI